MWIRTKEEAIKLVRLMKEEIPDVFAEKIEHSRFMQNLRLQLGDLYTATGEMPEHLKDMWENIFSANYKHDGCTRLGDEHPKRWIEWRYNGLRDFFTLLEEWVAEGFERGIYPVKPEQKVQKEAKPKGWWFFGNGVSSILQINGTNIPFESSAKGKGKGYPVILLQLLSWPGKVAVNEQEFGDTIRARWGIEDADTDKYKSRAFTDAIRDMNKDVKEALKTEDDFIVKNGSGYSVNDKFK
ncbi:MAG: hypothetical protein Q7S29_02980 [Candidatus Peribacter sp.]|nr:hypothetical protein [Candidatus Peribacter sp.]